MTPHVPLTVGRSAPEGTQPNMDYTNPEDVANIDEPTRQQEIGLLSGLIEWLNAKAALYGETA